MSLYAKVRCGNCGGKFDIYRKDFEAQDFAPRCPFCNTQMSDNQWDNLSNAYHTLWDWNTQTAKAHDEHGAPLWSAELVRMFVPREKIREND